LKVPDELKVARDLKEGAKLFKESKAARSLLGDNFVDHFSNSREWEYNEFSKNKKLMENNKISEWELSRYFEII